MLTLWGRSFAFCDRVTRRDFLRIGALGMGGMALPDLLRLRARAGGKSSPKSVIMISLCGGPSHIDMYDLKPNAPTEYRGEFKPIQTKVAGFDICEHLPLQAQIANKLAIVRSMQFHSIETHQLAELYTGFSPAANRPSFGSVISRFGKAPRSLLPQYVSLDTHFTTPSEDARFLGAGHQPLFVGHGVEGLRLPADLPPGRLAGRQQLLAALDDARRSLDRRQDLTGMDEYSAQAFDMISSAQVRDAFDLTKEPSKVRERYGSRDAKFVSLFADKADTAWPTDKFLLARRLVEAGVPVVTLGIGNGRASWDHHGVLGGSTVDIFSALRSLLPLLDRSLHALVTDLHERGLDKEVLVVVWGEFGRTPRITQYAGRDHWADTGFALFAGGGLRMGQVVGKTDRRAAYPQTRAYRPQNVLATIYRTLGIDSTREVVDRPGRPLALLDDSQPIAELI